MDKGGGNHAPQRAAVLTGLTGRFRLFAAVALLSLGALGLAGILLSPPGSGSSGAISGRSLLMGATSAGLVLVGVLVWRLERALGCELGGDTTELRARLRAIGDGDLASPDRAARAGSMLHAADGMRERLAEVMRAFASSATNIVLSVDQIGSACQRTANGVVEQRRHIEMVASAMTEMAASIQEIASNTAQASEAGGAATQEVSTGQAQARSTQQAVEQLAAQVEEAVARIDEARAESQRIASILNTIEGIAEQTNLLALNAAIEAARAGEQGRGFAVVAGEVRKLASHTRAATDESQEMIERLQSRSEQASAAVKAGGELAASVVAETQETVACLGRIAESVAQIDTMSERIAVAAEQQSKVAVELDASLASITGMAEQTDTAASAMTAANLTIGDESAHQFERIGHFDLGQSAFDFDRAMANHIVWKSRLRAVLAGQMKLNRDQVPDARHCSLGCWYYGPGGERYGHLPAMREIEAPHDEFHRQILRTVECHAAGQRAEAQQAFASACSLSETIVARIADLKQQVGA